MRKYQLISADEFISFYRAIAVLLHCAKVISVCARYRSGFKHPGPEPCKRKGANTYDAQLGNWEAEGVTKNMMKETNQQICCIVTKPKHLQTLYLDAPLMVMGSEIAGGAAISPKKGRG